MNPSSPFDDCFAMASDAEDASMAVDLTIDGNPFRGIVDTVDAGSVRKTGMDVTTYETSIFVSREVYQQSAVHKDSTVKVGTRTLRVLHVFDDGGAGARLDCGQANQRRVTVPGM